MLNGLSIALYLHENGVCSKEWVETRISSTSLAYQVIPRYPRKLSLHMLWNKNAFQGNFIDYLFILK
jgi:hypothetical protein